MNLADCWAVLVRSLGERTPETADETRDARAARVRMERAKRAGEANRVRHAFTMQQRDEAVLAFIRHARNASVSCVIEMCALTDSAARESISRLKDTGDIVLSCRGASGKKYWRAA